MVTAISEGVRITVNTQFRPDLSQLDLGHYFFNYRVEIENNNPFKIQLMHRDWYVFDSLNDASFVSGEGVIGEQPILLPGERFVYTSGAELSSEIGFMKGFYTFLNSGTETHFQVNVPTFQLISPPRLN
ncbi:MAG: Co2+/Mg2+ efflux protein ApaG [Crocinitomicaceae bacterium]|jgi:ApaG protein|nr:Co2+/Mg2+ efflux protein ApaG [Crocinitomicaceae bacterium]